MALQSIRRMPLGFFWVPVCLSAIGLLFIYSTGIQVEGGNTNQYLRQLFWILIGMIVAYVVFQLDYYQITYTSRWLYLVGIIALVMTLIFGREVRSSRSWLGIGGLGIQFSEPMKVFYILLYARFLANAPSGNQILRPLMGGLVLLAMPVGLILLQPDLGTALAYFGIFFTMTLMGLHRMRYLLYGVYISVMVVFLLLLHTFYQYGYLPQGNPRLPMVDALVGFDPYLAFGILLGCVSGILALLQVFQPHAVIQKWIPRGLNTAIAFIGTAALTRVLMPYQWSRLLVFISADFDPQGAGYNVVQSKVAIGSGGLFGKGLGQGTQNLLNFLPEKHNDFIFAIIGEEWGFLGAILTLSLFAYYLYLIVLTVLDAKDKEGAFIAAGILGMLFVHVAINLGMVLGITPATGLPLPFISYGGSNYVTFAGAAALLANIYSRRFVH